MSTRWLAVRRFLHGGRRPATDDRARSTAAGLTAREQEILELIAAGLSNKAIGQRLVVSARTVERHSLNIYAKLGVRSRAEAVAVGLHRSEQHGSR